MEIWLVSRASYSSTSPLGICRNPECHMADQQGTCGFSTHGDLQLVELCPPKWCVQVLIPSTCECDLTWKLRSLLKQLRLSRWDRPGFRMSPGCNGWCPCKRRGRFETQGHIEKRRPSGDRSRTSIYMVTAKQCLMRPEWEEGRFSLDRAVGAWPVSTLMSDFWPPEHIVGENILLLFQATRCVTMC